MKFNETLKEIRRGLGFKQRDIYEKLHVCLIVTLRGNKAELNLI